MMSTPDGPAGTPSDGPGRPPSPAYFELDGLWRIGHVPESSDDWALETRLRVKEATEAREWSTGRRPETEREWQLEYSFRELDNMKAAELARRDLEYRAVFDAAKQSAQSTNVRSWVLLGIVASIIVMPAIAMATGIAAQSFSQYIAPITGIAGTVLGYWFSQQTGSGAADKGVPARTTGGTGGTGPGSGSGFPAPPPQPN